MFEQPRISPGEVIFTNEVVTLYRASADFGLFKRDYYVIDDGARVGILAMDGDRVLLVRQYRFLLNGLSWEIPGGKVHEDESLDDAARRELREETGYECDSLTPLLSYEVGLDIRNNPTSIFLAAEIRRVGEFDAEIVETRLVLFDQCMRMVKDGEIKDVFTISALFARELERRTAGPLA